jgi:hypothetical protein
VNYSEPGLPQSKIGTRQAFVILALLVGLLAIWLYWPTLRLPLLYDDLLHIRIANGLNLGSVWLPTEAFGFYRPLTFLPMLLIERLFGHYPPLLLHGINVIQHALNAILLTWLSWRMWGRLHWALAAGLLFALFPFSYQAVAVYGHNVHPATTGLILLALHAYLAAVRASSRATLWWLATLALFILALLSHESAILFGAFAALVQWNAAAELPWRSPPGTKRRPFSLSSQPWILFVLLGVIYLVGYQFLPLSRAPQATFGGGGFWFKILYVVQAAAYPFARMTRFLTDDLAVTDISTLIGLALLLGLTAWSARRPANRLPLLLGWGWWGLASLLIALPLPASYLLHGPRLLYLGSAGLAFLWPLLLEPIYRLPRFGRPLWTGALLLILIANWLFVSDRLEAYAGLTSPVKVVKEIMAGRPDDEGILLVNLPNWLAPERGAHPVGVEFVAMMGDYLFVEELMAQNLGVDRPVQAIKVPDLLADPAYEYGIHEQATDLPVNSEWAPVGGHVFITTYPESGPQTRYAGRFGPEPNAATPVATFGPYELLDAQAGRCDGFVGLTTTWRPAPKASGDLKDNTTTSVFAQLLSEDGQLLGQSDAPLLGLRADLLQLPLKWQLIDVRELPAPGDPNGQALVGVYDFNSGERFPAVDEEGTPLAGDALGISVGDCD